MDLFVFPLPLILPTGISDIPSSICASVCVCVSMYLCRLVCLSVGLLVCRSMCVSFISSCVFLGEGILDFDVGNSDGGDGRSQGRVIPEGRVVRGDEDGEEGEAEWRERCCLRVSLNVKNNAQLHVKLSFLQSDKVALWNVSFFYYFSMVLLHSTFPLRFLFPYSHWSLSRSPCCHSGLWPLSPSLF